MSSFSYTDTEAFTIAHARRIASKVATDLLRFQSLYNGVPSDTTIDNYEKEIVEYLRHDVVESVTYGFKRDGKWTEAAVRYRALPGGTLVTDDDPGKIRPRLDVAGATFTSFLVHNNKRGWNRLVVVANSCDKIDNRLGIIILVICGDCCCCCRSSFRTSVGVSY